MKDTNRHVLNLDPNSESIDTLRFESVGSNLLQRFSISFRQLLTTQYFAKAVHNLQPHDIEKKIGHFQILVAGRANGTPRAK